MRVSPLFLLLIPLCLVPLCAQPQGGNPNDQVLKALDDLEWRLKLIVGVASLGLRGQRNKTQGNKQ